MLKGTCLSDKLYKLGKYLRNNLMFSLVLMVYSCSGLINAVQIVDVAGATLDNHRLASDVTPSAQDNNNNDNGDDEIIAGPRFLATVELAKTMRMYITKLTVLHIANKYVQNGKHFLMTLQGRLIKWTS